MKTKEIKVGNVVGFKHYVEQYGPVVEVKWCPWNKDYTYVVKATARGRVMDGHKGVLLERGINDIWIDDVFDDYRVDMVE